MSKEIRFNKFEEPSKIIGSRKKRDFGKEYGNFSRNLDPYVELENGTRVHPANPNVKITDGS